MNPSDLRRVEALMAKARAQRLPCLLCDGPPVFIGIFIPTKDFSRRLGAPAEKLRLAVYSLCQECRDLPGSQTLVEGALLENPPGTL